MQPTTQQDDRYQTTVNVRTFGAVGDGIHDDTHAFQEALDAIRECEGAVYVPAGTYLCGQINIYQGCAIFRAVRMECRNTGRRSFVVSGCTTRYVSD